MADIHIREYKAMDLLIIFGLLKLNTPTYFAPEKKENLLFYLQNEREQYYVLEQEGTIVGSGGTNFSEDRSIGVISWDIFHPAYQGHGLGSILLKFRLQKMKAISSVKTFSVRTSQFVYRFYEKHGFQLKEITENYWAEVLHLYKMDYQDS